MAARKKTTDSAEVSEVLTDEELKAAAEPEEASTKEGEPHKRTVVVAEDESVNRMDLVAMLEDNGYEVVGEAANGEEAIELTRKYRPDVVCMDVKMPRTDGITAAGVICDENIAPVVMLTAFSQPDLVKQATGAGAMAYVTKPYEERKLVDRAKGLLMDKADFSEQGAFRWIQKTSMDQRIPKKRLAMAIIAKYGEQKSEAEDER